MIYFFSEPYRGKYGINQYWRKKIYGIHWQKLELIVALSQALWQS